VFKNLLSVCCVPGNAVSLAVLQWTAHFNYVLGAVIPTYMYRVHVTVITREDCVLPAGVRKLNLGRCCAQGDILLCTGWHFVRKERHGNVWVQYQAVGQVQFCWKYLMFTVFHFAAFCSLRSLSILGLLCACVDVNCMSVTYLLTYLLTYSIQHRPSWEANRLSASQEIPRILWNPNVHFRIL
jgi:hypothetical protein